MYALNFPVHQLFVFLFVLQNSTKLRIADFVHGTDGLGNQNFPPPKGKPIEQSAVDFLTEQAKLYPGKVTVVALGPLTNIALVRFPDHLVRSLMLNIIHYILN
jgi:inosine-uridine nucleoside N-ribohydrolase